MLLLSCFLVLSRVTLPILIKSPVQYITGGDQEGLLQLSFSLKSKGYVSIENASMHTKEILAGMRTGMPPNQTSIVTRAHTPNQLTMGLGDREHTTKRVLRPR